MGWPRAKQVVSGELDIETFVATEAAALRRLAQQLQKTPLDESAGEWYHTITHGELQRAQNLSVSTVMNKLRFPYNLQKIKNWLHTHGSKGEDVLRYGIIVGGDERPRSAASVTSASNSIFQNVHVQNSV